MANLTGLSDAQAILLAIDLCATGNVSGLLELHQQFPDALPRERIFRIILTFLPESTSPQHYTPVLQCLADGISASLEPKEIDATSVKDLPEAVARKRVKRLRLLPLPYKGWKEPTHSADPLTQFLIHRAHRIDAETGLQTVIIDLLLPFYQRSKLLRIWLISRLLPLLRLNYEYYPNREETTSLDVLEFMNEQSAINILLSMTGPNGDSADLVRNLRGLVGPWIYGENQSGCRDSSSLSARHSSTLHNQVTADEMELSGWKEVNEWLLSHSLVDFGRVASAILSWKGPEDVDLGGYEDNEELENNVSIHLRKSYGQTGLAIVYANANTNKQILEASFQITSNVSCLFGLAGDVMHPLDPNLRSLHLDIGSIYSASKASLLQNALLLSSNQLTSPTSHSVAFLNALLLSLRILGELGYQTSCRETATVCLQSNDEAQFAVLRNLFETVVRHATPGQDWKATRQQLLWLQNWRTASPTDKDRQRQDYHGLFWRVPSDMIETEILKAMLTVGEYQLAADIFASETSPLKPNQVEVTVSETIITSYDNASNGNRTRGKMKKALDILKMFQRHFPDSDSFKKIGALISATHALSFYSLILQHGIPFQPVSIRVHPDPLSLVEKVLDQNSKSYTKLDDLLSIGRNLVAAGLPTPANLPVGEASSDDILSTIAERRIIAMAVSSALASDDFGTAYSYILTRLTPPSFLPGPSISVDAFNEDDISWRAAYNAGRHRSNTPKAENPGLLSQITNLSQRMELISLALLLAPRDALPEILGAWRRYDEELMTLRTKEAEEAEEWDIKGDKAVSLPSLSAVPGGFGPTDKELDVLENEKQRARRIRAQDRRFESNYEAPMGLFDVARSAARAISKNAFPLHGGPLSSEAANQALPRRSSIDSRGSADLSQNDERTSRVRKRDVVSNIVTGGLASGIGWVLGAQPVNR
ncbi:Sec39 domain containing protein [Elaphomyces granulatus]